MTFGIESGVCVIKHFVMCSMYVYKFSFVWLANISVARDTKG